MSLVPLYHASLALVESPVPLAANLQAVVLTGGVPISLTVASVGPGGIAPNVQQYDVIVITNQAEALVINNPVSSVSVPAGTKLMLRIRDDGTSRAISFGNLYRGMAKALPAYTVAGKLAYLGFIYDSTEDLWDLLAVVNQT